jgi:8-oxo-dGTP diphosphatase
VEKIPTLIVVAAALVDDQGQVLVQQRLPGRSMAGLWEFPGGKVEEGETAEAALVRELEEELGIKLDPRSLSPATFATTYIGDRPLILLLYLCRTWLGQPQPLDCSALQWLPPAQLSSLPMPPADEPFGSIIELLIPLLGVPKP